MLFQNNQAQSGKLNLFKKLSIVLLGAYAFAFLLQDYWVLYSGEIHTILELICIFIALSSFLVIWQNYDRNNWQLNLLGFAFLSVAIFDTLHTYYFQPLGNYPEDFYDLTTWYWLLGRFTEALALFLCTFTYSTKSKPIKYLLFLPAIGLALVTSYLVFYNGDLLPTLFTLEGLTTEKVVLEYVVIAILFLTLYRHHTVLMKKAPTFFNRYCYIAILFMIPAELSFTLFVNLKSFSLIFGHTLKIAYYFMLYKAIFVTSVSYPQYLLEKEIKERKGAERKLKSSEDKFQKYFQLSPDILTLNDIETGKFYDVNQAFEKSLGYKRNEIIGYNFEEIFKDVNFPKPLLENIKEKGKIENAHVNLTNKDGEGIDLLVSIDFANINGRRYYFSSSKDITKQRKMEKEMARLDRLNLVGQMAGGMGHEIRNPMTTVRGFLQLLGQREENKKNLETYKLMIEELDRANSIISEFLTLAADRITPMKEEDINRIIGALEPLMTSDALKSGCELLVEKNEVPKVLLNENEIRQVILNLVRNGFEAMPKGGRIKVRTYHEDKRVVLQVEDEGTGMDSEMLEKVGTPFVTNKDHGTGLGLATCFSIVAKHNAEIDIKTGKSGTTFYIRFKVAEIDINEEYSKAG